MGHFIIAAVPSNKIDLVLHQRDEGRNDDGDAFADKCRQLVAETLATTRGHDDKCIATRHQGFDRLFLGPNEFIEPKMFA